MPRPTEWITVGVNGVIADLSTATIEACDNTLRALQRMNHGDHGPFKGGRLDDLMYRAWCDVVLDRRNVLAHETGSMV